jgi:hypothetical protein
VEVIELGSNSVEVADAVVVAVGEAARINFVEDGVLPPLAAVSVGFLLGAGGQGGDRRAKYYHAGDGNFLKHLSNSSIFSKNCVSKQYQLQIQPSLNESRQA